MFQTQTKWKLGALLLASPLLMPVAARADYEMNISATEARDQLKAGFKWQNDSGEIYLFHPDGRFESRVGTANPDAYIYQKDFGRFTVRPVKASDNANRGEKYTLQLNVTSSLQKAARKGEQGRIVPRTATLNRPIKVMSMSNADGEGFDPGVYITLFSDRYNIVSR